MFLCDIKDFAIYNVLVQLLEDELHICHSGTMSLYHTADFCHQDSSYQ